MRKVERNATEKNPRKFKVNLYSKLCIYIFLTFDEAKIKRGKFVLCT